MKVLIREKISPHKFKTPEGYLICQDSILARTGKQTYRKNELFLDTDDDSEIEVDRPYDEVFSQETLASFENKPITIEHPDEDVTIDNYKDYAVGFVRDIRQGKTENGEDVIIGNLVITDKQAIEEIEAGQHTELSCGYDCDIVDEENPRQTKIRGNHVALCEQGRAGIAKIIDSTSVQDKYTGLFKKDHYYKDYVVEYNDSWNYYLIRQKDRGIIGYLAGWKATTLNELHRKIDNNELESFSQISLPKPKNDSIKDAPNYLTWDWWLNDHNEYDERISNILLSKVRLTDKDWEGLKMFGGCFFENYKETKGKEYNTDVHSSSFSTLQPIKYSVDVVWYRMGKDGNGIKQKQHVEFTENKEVYSFRGGYDSIKDESYPSRRGKKIHWDNRGLYGRILSDNDTLTNKTTIEETSTGKVYFISTRLMEKAIASGEAKIFDSIQDTLSPFDNGERYEVITHGRRKEYHEFTNDGEEAKREIQWNEGIYGMQELKDRKTGKVYRYANREIDKFNPNDSIGDATEKTYTIYLSNYFGTYKIVEWQATSKEEAVKEFLEKNPSYKKMGTISARDSIGDANLLGKKAKVRNVLNVKGRKELLNQVGKIISIEGTGRYDIVELKFDDGSTEEFEYQDIKVLDSLKDSNEKLYKVNGVFVSAIHPIDAVRKCRDAKVGDHARYVETIMGCQIFYDQDTDTLTAEDKTTKEVILEGKYPSLRAFALALAKKKTGRDSVHDGYYSDYDKKDKEFVKMALAEMRRYVRNWDYMSPQDKRNVGCTLGELKKRIAELEKVKDSVKDAKKQVKDIGTGRLVSIENLPTEQKKQCYEWKDKLIKAIQKGYPKVKISIYDFYTFDKKDTTITLTLNLDNAPTDEEWTKHVQEAVEKNNATCFPHPPQPDWVRIYQVKKKVIKDSINDYNPNNVAEIHAGDIYKLDYYQKIQGFILYYEIKEWDRAKHIGKIIEHWRYRDGTKETKTINVKGSDFDNYGIHLRSHINSHRAYKVSKVGDSIKVGDIMKKSELQKYLSSISKTYPRTIDKGIEYLTTYLDQNELYYTIEKIDGWKPTLVKGEYVKQYFVKVMLDDKFHQVLYEIYADMPDWRVKEINAYVTN